MTVSELREKLEKRVSTFKKFMESHGWAFDSDEEAEEQLSLTENFLESEAESEEEAESKSESEEE